MQRISSRLQAEIKKLESRTKTTLRAHFLLRRIVEEEDRRKRLAAERLKCIEDFRKYYILYICFIFSSSLISARRAEEEVRGDDQ